MINNNDSGVQSINRSLQILEAIANHNRGLTIAELVEELKLNKSTIHRILQALVAWGYIVKDEKTKTRSKATRSHVFCPSLLT